MNKAAIVAAIAQKSGFTKKEAEKALNAFVEVVEEALQKDEKVQIVGFGTFETKMRKERTGTNPQNGEVMKIAAARAPVFKAGKRLKDNLN